MDWIRSPSFLVCLFLFPTMIFAFKTGLSIKNYPNSNNLDCLTCAFSRMPSVRGVQFDTQTGTCAALADAWFNSPTYDAQINYFTLVSTKLSFPKAPFPSTSSDICKPTCMFIPQSHCFKGAMLGCRTYEQTDSFQVNFPANFMVDGSAIVDMETGTVGVTNRFSITFRPNNAKNSMYGFSMGMRENENAIIYNTRTNGVWGLAERTTNPFKTSNKTYKLEFKVTTTQVQTYIDDALFYSYNHRTSYNNYQLMYFESTVSTCDQVQFTYPDV